MQTLTSPTDSAADREALILEHLPAVTIIARQVHRRIPPGTSLDDLISAGTLGLIAAVDNFEPSMDVRLKTYAAHRIRGAMLDSLRQMDWARKGDRKRAKLIEATIARLEQRHHVRPEEADVASDLGIGVAEYRQWQLIAHRLHLVRLEADWQKDRRNVVDVMGDCESTWPCRIAERAELGESLTRAIQKLSLVEQKVLTMYFRDDAPLREIAQVVNRHQSRISQLKSQAISRLRNHLSTCQPVNGR